MAAEFDMDEELDSELETEDAELEKLYAKMDELLFDQKGYDKLPNSLDELEQLKAALPEQIKQARADLEKSVEAFKANITMPRDPDKVSVGGITFGIVAIIIAIACILLRAPLSDLLDASSFMPIVLGGMIGFSGVLSIKLATFPPTEEDKTDYYLACTDFKAYQEKKAKEFAERRESALYEREFRLGHERRLIDRKIAAVKDEMDYRAKHKPKCPTCGSERVAPIGEAERWMDSTGLGTVVGGGLNSPSLGKSYRCYNCGYRW